MRRTLVSFFGEDGLYGRAERAAAGDGRINGGLSVRTTLDPNLQRMARRALIDGLVSFDRERDGGDLCRRSTSVAIGATGLTGIETPNAWQPGRVGVVLEAQRTKESGSADPPPAMAASRAEREAVEIPFDEVQMGARPASCPRPSPTC